MNSSIKIKMNEKCGQAVNPMRQSQILVVVTLCGILFNATGCKTPGLRSAQPGPVAPANFAINNGQALTSTVSMVPQFSTPNDSSDEKVDSLEFEDDSETDNEPEKDSRRRGFQSFIKAATFVTPARQDDDDAVDIEDEIKRMESEVNEPSASSSDTKPKEDESTKDDDQSSEKSTPSQTKDVSTNIVTTPVSLSTDMSTNSAVLPKDAFYNDPFLMDLIGQTLNGNQELKILSEEINIACNESYARSGEYRPFVTLGSGAGFDKVGRHTREGAVEDQLLVTDGTEFPEPLGDFLVGANVSWEIDIWKRLRNSQRAAAMRYLGTQEGRNFIVTRVVAEVAENYYELLGLDNRQLTLQATVEIQQRSLIVAKSRKAAGRATELAVRRFEAEVEKNISELSLIRQEIVEAENRINYLAGRYPQPVQRITGEFVDLNLGTLGSGVPSELLQNRADIREAERQVAAAGLDVEVARARFYPSVSLSAGLGWKAFSTGYLFRTPESLVYSLANEVVGPLINKRAIQADYRSANAAQLQAIYAYQQTVLEAHIEVVNQITKVENYRQSIIAKKRQLDALAASVDVANKLFQNARAEYVEVLLAQRELMEARMSLIDIKMEQLSAVVNAYQALGGGGF